MKEISHPNKMCIIKSLPNSMNKCLLWWMQAMRPTLMPLTVCTNQNARSHPSVMPAFHFVRTEESRNQFQSVFLPNALQALFEVQIMYQYRASISISKHKTYLLYICAISRPSTRRQESESLQYQRSTALFQFPRLAVALILLNWKHDSLLPEDDMIVEPIAWFVWIISKS